MDAEVFVPFTFFLFLGAVILVPIWLKERTRQSTLRLVEQALDKGQPIDPEVLRQLTSPQGRPRPDRARSTLGSGVVLMGLALGFTAGSFMLGGIDDPVRGMLVPAAILGALGLAFILLAIVDYSSKAKGE